MTFRRKRQSMDSRKYVGMNVHTEAISVAEEFRREGDLAMRSGERQDV
jgi:hypothetical protein